LILNNGTNGTTGTFFNALVTVCTDVFVFDDLKNAYLFKKPGDKPCRTEKVAKWPVIDET
jgi:hypothetical protein